GFRLTEPMASAVRRIDLAALAPTLPHRTLVVVSQSLNSHASLHCALHHRQTPLAIEHIDSPAGWIEWPIHHPLVGIVTQPVDYEPEDRPVFVILNTGIIHRVGHHRMYVSLARALARLGYQVLRFDLSGIGDSESREDGLSLLDGALADVRE